MKKIW